MTICTLGLILVQEKGKCVMAAITHNEATRTLRRQKSRDNTKMVKSQTDKVSEERKIFPASIRGTFPLSIYTQAILRKEGTVFFPNTP